MSAAYPESPTEPDGYDPPATCAEGDCVRHATRNVEGRLVCGDHADEWVDPEKCSECRDRWAITEGTYAGLCGRCGLEAFREDEADRKGN